jgi:hypothetical protein
MDLIFSRSKQVAMITSEENAAIAMDERDLYVISASNTSQIERTPIRAHRETKMIRHETTLFLICVKIGSASGTTGGIPDCSAIERWLETMVIAAAAARIPRVLNDFQTTSVSKKSHTPRIDVIARITTQRINILAAAFCILFIY